jgi:predicted secreted Zn-dependent protease
VSARNRCTLLTVSVLLFVGACQAASPPPTAIVRARAPSSAPTLAPQPTNATRGPSPTPAPTAPAPTATPLPSPQPIPLPSPLPGVSVASKTRYYDVAGLSTVQLVDAMEQWAASNSPDGYWAGTRFTWDAHWDFRLSGTCRLAGASVSVRTFMTLPRWSIPADAPAYLVMHWKRFMEALTLHEGGHVAQGIRTGNEILLALKSVPRAATCDRLVSALQRTFDRVKEAGEARNTEYDRVTDHGRTQGAVFP